jgi:hypothetical protein
MAAPTKSEDAPSTMSISINPERPLPTEIIESSNTGDDQTGTEEQKPPLQSAVTNQSSIGSASVSGMVLDVTGGTVAGSEVTLKEIGGPGERSIMTGADGKFAFHELPAGSYVITVKAKGFEDYTSATFLLVAHQELRIPGIVLTIAAASAAVVVRPTDVIAAEQMKTEEKQRIIGIIPDFYTSYVWNAAPLNTRQKFSLSVRDTFDPVDFIGVSITAGLEQARNIFPGYGQGAEGYGKRWGATFADGVTFDILSNAGFPALFHQDPRYFYQGSGSAWSRIGHAISYAFLARSDHGRIMPNYSTFLGAVASGAISNLYYPAADRGAGLVFANAGISLAGRAGDNLLREFVIKRFTRHVPANGKPATGNDTH